MQTILRFTAHFSLINSDQGVRGYLQVVNDLCYYRASALKLNRWMPDARSSSGPVEAVDRELRELSTLEFAPFITAIASVLAGFDWRASSTPDLDENLRRSKLVFRGSSGYKELRRQLLEHLGKGDDEVAKAAKSVARET